MRKLKYFVALAEELHFRRAAARLAISQPPLSSAIKMIEDELGTALFARNSKKVSLTAAGAAFYPEALKVVAQLELACATAREVGAGNRGRLEIGFVGGMVLRGVPEAVSAYSMSQGNVTVSLREMSSAEQMQAIVNGHLAGGFLHSGADHPDLQYLVLARESFVCCVPAAHRLARYRKLDLQALAKEDFIIFAREASPTYYDSVIGMCAAAGFSPNIRHQVTRWFTALLLVSRAAGVALIPDAFVKAGLAGVAFPGLKNSTTRSIAYFAWRRDNDNAALRRFVSLLQSRYKTVPANRA